MTSTLEKNLSSRWKIFSFELASFWHLIFLIILTLDGGFNLTRNTYTIRYMYFVVNECIEATDNLEQVASSVFLRKLWLWWQYLALANYDMDLLWKMHFLMTRPMFNRVVWVQRNDLVETRNNYVCNLQSDDMKRDGLGCLWKINDIQIKLPIHQTPTIHLEFSIDLRISKPTHPPIKFPGPKVKNHWSLAFQSKESPGQMACDSRWKLILPYHQLSFKWSNGQRSLW